MSQRKIKQRIQETENSITALDHLILPKEERVIRKYKLESELVRLNKKLEDERSLNTIRFAVAIVSVLIISSILYWGLF